MLTIIYTIQHNKIECNTNLYNSQGRVAETVFPSPPASTRQHLSNHERLEDKTDEYANCIFLYCVMEHKKRGSELMSITLSNLNRFSQFFHC